MNLALQTMAAVWLVLAASSMTGFAQAPGDEVRCSYNSRFCGGANEDSGTEQTLCPNCAQVRDALNFCGLGPESLRELFDTLRVIGPSEMKAKMEALRDLGVQMDMQDRSQLN